MLDNLDGKVSKLLRRLERLAANKGPPLGTKEIASLQLLVVDAATNAPMQVVLLRIVLGLLLEADHIRRDQTARSRMTKLAVSLCSSCCGTKVHVDVPVAAVSAAASAEAEGVARVGVLILGFSGCSLEQMKPARSVYMSRWPAWRVVAAVRPGLRWGLYASGSDESELFEADRAAERVLSDQRNAVLAQLEGVDKVRVGGG